MTCGYCDTPDHNKRRCPILQEAAQTVQDVPLSALQASQDTDFVFMPNSGFASFSQPIFDIAGPSNSKGKAKDKVAAPSKRSAKNNVAASSSINQPFVPSRALVDEDDDEGELDDEDDQPILRPKVISEAKTRLKRKKLHQQPTGARKIGFKGDDNGVSMPTNLPYSPRKLAWRTIMCDLKSVGCRIGKKDWLIEGKEGQALGQVWSPPPPVFSMLCNGSITLHILLFSWSETVLELANLIHSKIFLYA